MGFQGEDVFADVDAATTASDPALDKLQLAAGRRRSRSRSGSRSRITGYGVRSTHHCLRKLGCDMGLTAHRATGALGCSVGSWQGSPELQLSLNLGVAWAARHLLQA